MVLSALDFISSDILQALAWIFTVLSGVASIALTIHKFGLSPAKRIMLVVGVIILGLGLVTIIVPGSRWGISEEDVAKEGGVTTADDLVAIREMIDAIGSDRVNGLLFHDDGRIEVVFASAPVQRDKDSQLYAVQFDEEKTKDKGVNMVVAYSGTAFEAQIGDETQNVEIIESSGGDVLVTSDDGFDVVNPDEGASESGIRVEKLDLTE